MGTVAEIVPGEQAIIYQQVLREAIGRGMNAYWEYEKFLRKKEASIGSMLGATGAIYAVRRNLYTGLPQDMLVDDMYVPFSVIHQGQRAVFESGARAYDRASTRGQEEFKRKVRTLAGNYQIFQLFPGLFNPLKSPIALQLFSHKFLRLMVPIFSSCPIGASAFACFNRSHRSGNRRNAD